MTLKPNDLLHTQNKTSNTEIMQTAIIFFLINTILGHNIALILSFSQKSVTAVVYQQRFHPS